MIRLSPFFSYYGSKYRLAPRYPPPRFNTIIEPFAGSAQYATLYHTKRVILIEKYKTLADLWRYLIEATKKDILSLPLIGPDQTVHDFDLSPDEKHLIGFWLNKASSSPGNKKSSWAKSKPFKTEVWSKACRSRLANQIDKINHWSVIHCGYEEYEHEINDFRKHYQMELVSIVFLLSLRALQNFIVKQKMKIDAQGAQQLAVDIKFIIESICTSDLIKAKEPEFQA